MGIQTPFAQVFRRIRDFWRPRQPRPVRLTLVVLEPLEERAVMAAFSGAAVVPLPSAPLESIPLIDSRETLLIEKNSGGEVTSVPVMVPSSDSIPIQPLDWNDSVTAPPASLGGSHFTPNPRGMDSPLVQPIGGAPTMEAMGDSSTPIPASGQDTTLQVAIVQLNAKETRAGDTSNTVFRITRTSDTSDARDVRFTVSMFSNTTTTVRDCLATIPARAASVDIPIDSTPTGKVNSPEVVTLTLADNTTPTRTVTWFANLRTCSETALFAAYREGQSPEAFNILLDRHRTSVLRTCYQVLGNWHDAEDVCQLVFLSLAQHQVKLQSTLAGWLRTVARNAAIVFLRSRNRRHQHEQRAAKPDVVASAESNQELREELDLAMEQMSAHLREAVRLRYLEGWSQREAAAILGCPRGTLSQRAALGVQCLRGILGVERE
jgi:RNA polymerase sigma-70 factor (ECF subfamily)